MTRPSKRKTKEERDNNGKFAKKPRIVDDWMTAGGMMKSIC